jgi:chorismate mutase
VSLRSDTEQGLLLPAWLRSAQCPATREAACRDGASSFPSAPFLLTGTGAGAALVAAVDARLGTMRAMAATKWIAGVRIEDPPREGEVLAAVTALALEFELDTGSVCEWFVVQMSAARELQRRWHAAWSRSGMCGECRRPPDIAVLRRFIDETNAAQLRALHDWGPRAVDGAADEVAACLRWLGRRYGVEDTTSGRLVAAWWALCRAMDRGDCTDGASIVTPQ